MKGTMRISTKGQITIPQEIREEAGVGPGMRWSSASRRNHHTRPQQAGQDTRAAPRGAPAGRATMGMTTDEIMALTRGEP